MNEQNTANNPLPAAPFGEVFRRFLNPVKYFTEINGRARRGEFWSAALMVVLPSAILHIIVAFACTSAGSLALYIVLSLPLQALLFLMCPIAIRRWHDLGVSGWTFVVAMLIMGFPCSYLGSILSFAAGVTCLVFFCLPGRKGDNAYGADPCDPAAAEPTQSIKEPWQPLIITSAVLFAINWLWGVYNVHAAIELLESMSSLFRY